MRVRRRAGIMLTLVTLVTGLALGLALPGGSAVAQGICTELITDGGLESGAGWTLGLDPAQPQYVTGQVHAGARALQLGIPTGAPNQRSYSSVRQLVTIAPDAAQVTLNFWYLALMPGAPTTDYVEMALLGPDGHDLLDKPWRSFVNNRLWNGAGFDLSSWRGQTLQVYFNVYNDGLGPSATMYLDDVSLQACTGGPATGTVTPTASWTPTGAPTLTPTPTALPTWTLTPYPTALPTWTLTPAPLATVTPYPTASLTPTGLPAPTLTPAPTMTGPPPTPYPPIGPPSPDCIDLLMNGDFEQGVAGWELAPNKLPVLLVGAPSVHSGVYAVRLGTQETSGVQSYSSIRQQVYIPPGYAQILWQFWTWTWAETPAGSDHQEADFLDPDPAVLQKFWRVLTNDQAWVPHSIPVTNYSGRTVVVYLNDYNDGVGGRSAMFLDDVHLWACPGALSAAAAAVPPAAPPPAAAAAPAAAAPVAPLPAPTATATVAPIMTVLTLVTVTPSPLPATATSSALVQTPPPPALGPIVVAATPTRTPTPAPGFLDRVAAALHLPPPPPYWPLGLLAIVIVLLLLFVLLRQPAP